MLQSLDGSRTVADAAAALRGEGVPVSESALASFAQTLSRMNLLQRTLGDRSTLELERLRAERRQRRRPRLFRGELLRMRWQLADPDAAFDRWLPRLRFLFSPAFLAASVMLFAVYVLIVALKWTEFRAAVLSLYTPSDYTLGKFAVLWGTGLVIIAVHELGHGITCKHFGGHVHEMGAMLIYFEPAFYCNVNDAWTFPDRAARLWVTAAGSWIQLVLAAVGAIVWWAAAPGTLLSQIALAAVLIGGLTTVLANANPLMPLDGYYALSDWLEIPNLRQRALEHVQWLIKRRVLRLDLPMPQSDARERRVFAIYGMLALGYTGFSLALVAVVLSGWASRAFGAAGLVLVLGGILLLSHAQLGAGIRVMRGAVQEARVRWKGSPAVRRTAGGAAFAALALLVVPWPLTISAPFVVAPPETLVLSAPDSGTVAVVTAREGMRVDPGAPLLRLRNVALEREAIEAELIRDSLARRERTARARSAAGEAGELDRGRAAAAASAAALDARVRALTLRAPSAGQVVTARPEQLTGRPVEAGAILLTVAAEGPVEARLALAGPGATLVRPGAAVRLLGDDGQWGRGTVTSLAALAGRDGAQARVRILDARWRPGVTGRARVTLRRSSMAGALWWKLRSLVRTDLWL